MSLESSRALPERLIAFLHMGGHTLPSEAAQQLCSTLAADPKQAAKQLRTELAKHAIAIKHTHALKAVAEMRGTAGHLGLVRATWEVASWVAEAPAVSARRRKVASLREAADMLLDRLREQLDPGDRPVVQLLPGDRAIELNMIGLPTPGWRALLVHTIDEGQLMPIDFDVRRRLGERLRRLVEGEFGGWVDGLLTPRGYEQPRFRFRPTKDAAPVEAQTEYELAARIADGNDAAGLQGRAVSAAVDLGVYQPMVRNQTGDWQPLPLEALADLVKRLRAFGRRTGESYSGWLDDYLAGAKAGFSPEPLNVVLVRQTMAALSLTEDHIAQGLGVSLDEWRSFMENAHLPVHHFQTLAGVLQQVSIGGLLSRRDRPLPLVPIRDDESFGVFLGHVEYALVDPSVGLNSTGRVREHLRRLCGTTFEIRRRWNERAPEELSKILSMVEAEGNVLCARMDQRFVEDLPLGRERLAIVLVLCTEPQRVVDQYAPQSEEEREPFDDEIDENWLARFNRSRFTGDDLLRYSNTVAEMREDDEDADDGFTTLAIAGVRAFPKDADRAHAATVRMEALARLMRDVNLEPWIKPGAEDGASMLSRPVFEAVARCPLTAVNGRAGFDAVEFQTLIVKHTVLD